MAPVQAPAAIEFDRFTVLPDRRELLADGKPVKLGGRAFDVLIALIETPGAVLSKDALMARVWPDRIVEENNLQAQISALRTAFGPDRNLIRTVPGRGYQFTGEIWGLPAAAEARADTAAVASGPRLGGPQTNLPAPVSELIGRDEEIAELLNLTTAHRLVTLTGAGGIGKTRLALALARELLPHFADGAWLAELSALADPGLVSATVAAAVGLDLTGGEPSAQRVAQALSSRQLLLIVDNCEHVVEAAARMAEALLRANSAARVIATSREPLRAEGEWVYTVPSLAVPAEGRPDGEDPLRYGAVELFVERARAAAPSFSPHAPVAATIAAICRRLDGIPLAIELAAARVAALGIEGLAAGLDDRFHLLTGGRRTALPRHQTLRATLDWGYDLLTEPERVVLRRLAIFAGGFTLQAASAVATDDAIASDVIDCVANLVAKSLVTADVAGAIVRYRLLETTRAYALEKLVESGERERLSRRHAEYYHELFERAEVASEMRPAAEWLAEYGLEIDNLRAALDWAFSPGGDTAVGVALTVASGLLWTRLSLSDECRRLTKRALSALGPGSDPATRHQIQLLALLGWSLQQTSGATSETRAAFSKILELSENANNIKFKSLAMWGLWIYHFNNGEFATAIDLAQKSIGEEGVDTIHLLAAERIIGLSLHYLGEQSSSRRQIESVLRRPVDPLHQPHDLSFAIDHRVTLRAFLARILWLQGFPDQAMCVAKENVEDALALNHALSLANALVQAACPVAFFIGDLVAAEHFVRMLLDHSTKHALGPWQAWGRCFEGMLLIKRGDLETGLQRLGTAISGLCDIGYAVYYVAFTGELAEALGRAGQAAHGLATIDDALARSERSEERWCVAELLRIKGELVVLQGGSGAKRVAEEYFRQSLDWARRQGALSWELRAAMSLARLMLNRGRPEAAKQLLAPVFRRFTEGFDTADLRQARTLLDQLG